MLRDDSPETLRPSCCCACLPRWLTTAFSRRRERGSGSGLESHQPLLPEEIEELIPGYASLAAAHATLPRERTRGRRVILVGDVHGCADELDDLLRAANYARGKDLLVFVGDLVAKGPKSQEVVQRAREENALAVRGNHDHYVLLRRHDDLHPEREHAKLAREVLSASELDWLEALPLSLRIDEHKITVVHAGMRPGTDREQNSLQDLLHMRNVRADGAATSSHSDGVPWVDKWSGPDHVVFGHDAMRKLQRAPKATGLDTGCVYGGSLTALIMPGNKLVSVPARKTHKPPTG